ncbi:hypothetical protein SBADM41S_06771 [Streptomyces badius]
MGPTLGAAADRFKVHFHDELGDKFGAGFRIRAEHFGAADHGRRSGSGAGPRRAAAESLSPAWELLLPAAAAQARGRGRALRSALREAVPRCRRLSRAAHGCPPAVELAADLRVSRGLVTEAYEQLTAGDLRARAGRGHLGERGCTRGGASRTRPTPGAEGARVDFRPGTPICPCSPRSAWAAARRTVLRRSARRARATPDPRGLPELREALAGLLARAAGRGGRSGAAGGLLGGGPADPARFRPPGRGRGLGRVESGQS